MIGSPEMMSPGLRRLALIAHVVCSVGWIGAIAGFFPLAIAALTSQVPQTVRSAYLAMALVGRFVLVPIAFASLLSGLIMALGTRWGLLRHYWVLIKFLITALATLLLLKYMQSLGTMASTAVAAATAADLAALQHPTHVVHASLAVVALLVNTVLSMYKPRGLTRYGRRRLVESSKPSPGDSSSPTTAVDAMVGMPSWAKVLATIGIALLGLLVVRLVVGHVAGHAGHGH